MVSDMVNIKPTIAIIYIIESNAWVSVDMFTFILTYLGNLKITGKDENIVTTNIVDMVTDIHHSPFIRNYIALYTSLNGKFNVLQFG